MGVKSAERALAILEYLRQRPSSTVGEISSALSFPNSSTSLLLKTLATAGYVSHPAGSRRFRQTYRVALLGAGSSVQQDARLRDALDDIHRLTGQTVLVGFQSGPFVRYIHLIDTKHHLVDRLLPVDQLRLMSYNVLGRRLLAALSDARVRGILRHNNAHRSAPTCPTDEATFVQEIAAIRNCGYAEGCGKKWPDAHLVAMLIRPDGDAPPLAVGVGGPLARADHQRRNIIACMRKLLAPWQ